MSPMPSKGGFWSDTFEQLAELGVSTAKQTGQAVKQTFSPLKLIDKFTPQTTPTDSVEERSGKTESVKKINNTPLNFQKLQQSYENQDARKTEVLRSRLFQLVKSGEEKVLEEKEKKKQRENQEQANKEHEETRRKQQQAQQQQGAIPQGKVRRSILGGKQTAKQQQVEIKPSTGKQ